MVLLEKQAWRRPRRSPWLVSSLGHTRTVAHALLGGGGLNVPPKSGPVGDFRILNLVLSHIRMNFSDFCGLFFPEVKKAKII